MKKHNIVEIKNLKDGIQLIADDGRTAFFRFADSILLKKASESVRFAYTLTPMGIRWEDVDEDISFESIFDPERFPLKIAQAIKAINVSEVARRLGIQQSLMAAYIAGTKVPSAERQKKIIEEIHKIGQELEAC